MFKRKLIIMGLVVAMLPYSLISRGAGLNPEGEPSKKLVLSPYGFLKGDMFYSTAGVSSFGALTLGAPQLATGTDRAAMGFTAQHTRLGLRGSVGENIKAGGLVEIDFFSNAFDANGKPRIRLGYASVAKGGFEARFGQQWDLFSPNNANTNNTNGNMWFAGNRGFRRAQVQLSYRIANDAVAPMLQVSLGEACREEAGLGKDNLSAKPMMQARLSGTISSKYVIGLSFVSASFLETAGTVVGEETLNEDFTFNTSGICVDFNLPLHNYFSVLGEFNLGSNLNNANLFNISGNHSWSIVSGRVNENNKKTMGLWLNVTSRLSDHIHLVVGYGLDKNTGAELPTGALDKNQVVYGNLTFPVNHGFSLSLEYMNINTTRVTGPSSFEDMKAGVLSLSGKISF